MLTVGNCHRVQLQDTTPVRQSVAFNGERSHLGKGRRVFFFSLLDEVLELMENEKQRLYMIPSPQGLFLRRG